MNKIKNIYNRYEYYINYIMLISINLSTSILNYISSIYINRSLSISDFAQYNGLLNIYTIISLTLSSFSYYIMHNYKESEDAKKYWAFAYFFASVITILHILSIPLIDILFNIKSYISILIIAIATFITILFLVSQSILRINNYIKYDYISAFISTLLIKIILLAYFIISGLNLVKTTSLMLLFPIIYLAIHIVKLKKINIPYYIKIKEIKKYINKKELQILLTSIINIIIINFIFNWISLNDVLMANRYLDKISAGYYSTISLIVKMFFYIATPISTIMFSYIIIAMRENNKNKEKKIIYSAFLFFIICSILLSIFLVIFAKEIVLIQFTNRYSSIIPLIPKACLFGFSLGFALLVFNYSLAYKLYKPFYFYMLIFLYSYLSLRNGNRDFDSFINTMNIFFILLLVYNIIILISHRIMKN